MSGMPIKIWSLRSYVPKLPSGRVFNGSAGAGPRRLMMLTGAVVGVTAVVVAVSLAGESTPTPSRDARMHPVDPLPAGLHTTPEQDALALRANTAQGEAASARGQSYTPPLAPSQAVQPPPLLVEQASPPVFHEPTAVAPVRGRVAQPSDQELVPEPLRVSFPMPTGQTTTVAQQVNVPPRAIPVAAPAPGPDPAALQAQQQAYNAAIRDLFNQWGGRLPRTDVILPPPEHDPAPSDDTNPAPRPASTRTRTPDAVAPIPVANRQEEGRILIPAGRAIYAHPVLAVNSDASSPVVFQADTGPIAGDRMIGTFAKQEDRLVIHISSVIHNGEAIATDGLVIAPGSMETSVASNVDQHYLSRFVLPAAAAFVAGLGQAIAQTSNSAAVLSPFGGVTTSSNLNIRQQAGIAAGTAASQIGTTLNQAAPKGTTVTLEPNVAVGVMFLSNVTSRPAQ